MPFASTLILLPQHETESLLGITSGNLQGAGGSSPTDKKEVQLFDALVVCNGHYSEPRTPELPGSGVFPGYQIHSHNYRDPEPFRGQRVVIIGAAASGEDIAHEISAVADQV